MIDLHVPLFAQALAENLSMLVARVMLAFADDISVMLTIIKSTYLRCNQALFIKTQFAVFSRV